MSTRKIDMKSRWSTWKEARWPSVMSRYERYMLLRAVLAEEIPDVRTRRFLGAKDDEKTIVMALLQQMIDECDCVEDATALARARAIVRVHGID